MDSSYTFSKAPQIDIPRSVFNRNFNIKTAFGGNSDGINALLPIYVDECLPGDTWRFKQHLFGRLTTALVPLMDNLYLDTFFFAVPVRLVDPNFKRLMGERDYNDISNDYVAPMLSSGDSGVANHSLYDYLGIPPGVPNLEFSAWFPRAYTLIYDEWFRDEDLCPRRMPSSFDNEDISTYTIRRRCKQHDYFTTCRPWPQKGATTSIPLGGTIPIVGNGQTLSMRTVSDNTQINPQYLLGYQTSQNANAFILRNASENVYDATGTNYRGLIWGQTGLSGVLSSATTVTINQLREAFAIQQFLETDARSGTRYTEVIRGHFGVISPDARQQRPEYLGGASSKMTINTVAQTSASSGDSSLGDLASFITMRSDASWEKSFTEHTIIIGLASVRADISYQQGLPRMFSRKSKFDFYWPQLANLGEQAVLNKEIYAQGTSADNEVFGYQERWSEYRYHPNMITGALRSTYAHSLDVWHLAEEFDSLPRLNYDFIAQNVPIGRSIAVQNESPVIIDGWFEVECARPMPLYSVPGLNRM